MDNTHRLFLGIEESVLGQSWLERLTAVEAERAGAISEQLEVSELVARVMAGRGIMLENAAQFLKPTLREEMPDPSTLTDMDRAADRLAAAIKAKERIAIFGDYDVDGATSSALMSRYLTHFDAPHEIYIPDRIFEGYGPNETAIRELIERKASLIITVDCGSTSNDTLSVATELGVDVVIIDHHQVGDALPEVSALVNPNRHDDLSGQGHLCAVGVVFLVLVALNRKLKSEGMSGPDLMDWLDIVALGTVCDVVPLKGLNRPYILRGLDIIRQQKSIGLAALSKVARQDGPAMPWHLGFLLGPRINAGGRIGDADLGARLLTTEDSIEAEAIAIQLDTLNSERQAMEAVMLEDAINEAEGEIGTGDGPVALITESDNWHAGVVGLIASRLKDRYRRPAFAIVFDHRDIGTGSARSVPGIDVGAIVRLAVDEGILEKGGGHAMAAGITIHRDQLGDFRAFVEQKLTGERNTITDGQSLKIDGALSARGATRGLFEALEKAGPYGAGHNQPIFAFPNHTVRYAAQVGRNHVRFTLGSTDGGTINGIGFRIADTPLGQMLLKGQGNTMHFAGTLSSDFYRGQHRMQLRLIDAALPAK